MTDQDESPLERRAFLKALVASVVAAGAPLPVGFDQISDDVIKIERFSVNTDLFLHLLAKRAHHEYQQMTFIPRSSIGRAPAC